MAKGRISVWHRRPWLRWVAGGLLVALVVAAVLVDLGLRRAEPFLRARLVEQLEDRFHARVELDSFHVSLVKGLWAEGKGLRIWPPAQVEGVAVPVGKGEPLISLDEFRFRAPLHFEQGKPIRISVAELKGLHIDLPPRSHFEHLSAVGTGEPRGMMAGLVSFEVDTMQITGAVLVMETSKQGKLPLDFQIAHLKLSQVVSGGAGHPQGEDRSAHPSEPKTLAGEPQLIMTPALNFEAELTNPRPKGTIHTTGTLGPLQGVDLGEIPIEGSYRFEDADLSSFTGIAGTLSSTGQYQGTLRDLRVDGKTETPNFRLTHFGNAMALNTSFHARVDGTNGDTWLEPVDATLGHSHFTATGQIVRVRGEVVEGAPQYIGHDIALTVNVDKGRIEDFMRLASRSDKVLITGDVTVKTTLHIPPGKEPVHERLKLNGWFSLDKALFTSEKIQEHIAELSLRGQGRPDELKTIDPASVLSHMESNFQLASGVITLPALDYTVPGAKIELKGTYTLEGGTLNFDGNAKMEAPVSKMVGGWKGLLLTPADPLFKKGGAGTQVAIHVKGTREAPEFGIDFEKLKLEKKPSGGSL